VLHIAEKYAEFFGLVLYQVEQYGSRRAKMAVGMIETANWLR
jgi:hypothetical protein